MSDSLLPQGLQTARLLCPGDSPGEDTGVGYHSLLQDIFPTEGSNLHLQHCRQILYCLSHHGRNVRELRSVIQRKREGLWGLERSGFKSYFPHCSLLLLFFFFFTYTQIFILKIWFANLVFSTNSRSRNLHRLHNLLLRCCLCGSLVAALPVLWDACMAFFGSLAALIVCSHWTFLTWVSDSSWPLYQQEMHQLWHSGIQLHGGFFSHLWVV